MTFLKDELSSYYINAAAADETKENGDEKDLREDLGATDKSAQENSKLEPSAEPNETEPDFLAESSSKQQLANGKVDAAARTKSVKSPREFDLELDHDPAWQKVKKVSSGVQ